MMNKKEIFSSPLKPEIIERHWDLKGHGDYGMPRGSRKHKGWDIVGEPGDTVFAPFDGVVKKHGYMYSFALQFRYIEIENETYRIRLGYAKLAKNIKVGDRVVKKLPIGELLDIGGFWGGGMKNHLHVQLWKNGLLTDPEPLFK